jgi:hypothetical protein
MLGHIASNCHDAGQRFMTLNANSVLIGILAGIASALLLLSAGQPSMLSVILFAGAALPIFIAGLGWSNKASFTAVIVAFGTLLIAADPHIALINAVTTLLPSAWLAHLSTLARPASDLGGPDDELVWYPLPQLMLHGATLMILATLMIGWAIDYSPELSDQFIDALLVALNQNGDADFRLQDVAATKKLLSTLLPMTQSAMWVIILFIAWYFASAIVRMSGRSKRPRDNMHVSLRMPQLAMLFLGFGAILMFFDGQISYIGATIVGGFGAGFLMAGLAVLHQKTLGKIWRNAALWGTYVTIVIFSFPAAILVIVGLFEAGKHVPLLVSKSNDINEE